MLAITVAQVRAASLSRVNEANLNSLIVSLDLYARRGRAAYPCSVHAADLSIHVYDIEQGLLRTLNIAIDDWKNDNLKAPSREPFLGGGPSAG
ncbi:hypothetical protein ACLJYM_18715 [Rhizobium giardinii]|uniref:hypothetical protein n=1 Tax=Rhizobium giardinii TaxID=56731 RepID=UPI0039E1EA50